MAAGMEEDPRALKVGRFAIANRLEPHQSLKSNLEVFGCVLQCRTGHAYIEESRQSFLPLSLDPITCPWDNECNRMPQVNPPPEHTEDTYHIESFLGTKNGIAAHSEFLSKPDGWVPFTELERK